MLIGLLMAGIMNIYAQTYTISGPGSVNAGTAYTYTVTPSIPANYSWTANNGTISNPTTSSVTVTWGCATSGRVTITNGSNVAFYPVTINSSPTLVAGSIAPTSQNINYNTSPATFTSAAPSGGNCANGAYTYQWEYSTNGGSTYTAISGATSLTYASVALTAPTTLFHLKVMRGTGTNATAYSNAATVNVYPQVVAAGITPATQQINYNSSAGALGVSTAATGGNGTYTYQWQSSTSTTPSTFANIPGATGTSYLPGNLTTTMYYRVIANSNGATAASNYVTVNVYPQLTVSGVSPAALSINYNTSPGVLTCTPSGGNGSYDYQWWYSTDNNTYRQVPGATSQNYTPGNLLNTMYYRVVVFSNLASVTSNLSVITVPNAYGVAPATNMTGSANSEMNWTKSTVYDAAGNILGQEKTFFDKSGRMLQQQNKVFYRKDDLTVLNHVLASQPVQDAYGRGSLTTMQAPIDYADFNYMPGFIQATDGTAYSYKNFDRYKADQTETDKTNNPDPVGGQSVKGTLGWYYGPNNTWEPYTPTTAYPFSRQTYYQDGTGNSKKSAAAGEALKMGTGHESSSYVVPVINELDNYVQVRNRFFASTDLGVLPSSLLNHAIQTVGRDANGVETVSIQDQGGKILMTARPGAGLTVNNTATVTTAGAGKSNLFYFKLFTVGSVTITGGTFTLYDMNTEQSITFTSGNTLAAGYYKLVNTGTTSLNLAYSNSYSDVSYNFYNQLGQMVASISPEGTKKLYGAPGLNAYATRTAVPFISLMQYDNHGRLIMSTDPDRGTSRFIYRIDGKLRFSQNPIQAAAGSFNYINYDQWGRPIESGQYLPGTGGITFGSTSMTGILENIAAGGGLTSANNTRTDVCTTLYDLPDNSLTVSGYTQDPLTLAGSISMTQKYSRIINNVPSSNDLISTTWYNYDEEGKMIWVVRNINGMGGYKVTDYTYDGLDRLIKKVFHAAGTAAETFAHYYDYDPANGNLWHVYTSTTPDNNKQLQATYIYYLHGRVKRIELASDLQGVDYTYTLKGALKAINNSKRNADPAGDGTSNSFSQDAFGEVLDYFPGDYTNSRMSISAIAGVTAPSMPDSYAGNIKAMTWYSEKPSSSNASDAPTTYVYQYDPKYQFTESTWGTNINFATNPATYTATSNNKEKIGDPANNVPAYDDNGNIQYLQRTDAAGTSIAQFRYHYDNNNNQLTSIVNAATSQNYATFNYDQAGEVTGEVTTDGLQKYIEYDIAGLVTGVYRDLPHSQPVATFVYDELGRRIKKIGYNASGQVNNVTYYVDDVIYTLAVTNNGTVIVPQEYQITGMGRLGIYYPNGIYAYELDDQLGNVRAVVARNANTCEVRMYTDYYPYGMVIGAPSGTNDYRYGYQGKNAEKDGETGWNAFELRMYDGVIARWLQYDPKGQFRSPYVAMGNNPVSGIDHDGGTTDNFFQDKTTGAVFWSNDNAKYDADSRYQDLGDRYFDGHWINIGFNGMPDGAVRSIEVNAKWRESDLDAWNKFYSDHDKHLINGGRWAPGNGYYLLGNPVKGYYWGFNDAITSPTIDPIDFIAGGIPTIVKGVEGLIIKKAAVSLLGSGARMTADQIALKELVHEATLGGRKAISEYEANAIMDMAEDIGYPGFSRAAADFRTVGNHWVGGPHINFPGVGNGHISVVP